MVPAAHLSESFVLRRVDLQGHVGYIAREKNETFLEMITEGKI
jgi:hypothetical protein